MLRNCLILTEYLISHSPGKFQPTGLQEKPWFYYADANAPRNTDEIETIMQMPSVLDDFDLPKL